MAQALASHCPLQAAEQCAADATQSEQARLASLHDSAASLDEIAILSGDWGRAARTVLSVAALHQQELQGWQLGHMLGAGSFGVVLKVGAWLRSSSACYLRASVTG